LRYWELIGFYRLRDTRQKITRPQNKILLLDAASPD